VNGFTFEREVNDSLSPETVSFRKIRIDSKGRISIPSDLRKSLGLAKGSDVLMGFDLEKGIVFLICGQGGVVLSSRKGSLCITVNMGDCGSPDAGSNLGTSESPAPDPENNLIDTNKISNG
jgi:AbrB family looped-hinge helix DNA binding protein